MSQRLLGENTSDIIGFTVLRNQFVKRDEEFLDHVSQALVDLHSLPVRYRIQYKLALTDDVYGAYRLDHVIK